MSGESLVSDGEVVKIANVIGDWIKAERNISSVDRNSYLDRLDEQRRFLALPMDDPSNQSVNKLYSHLQRLPIWFEAFSLDPAMTIKQVKSFLVH